MTTVKPILYLIRVSPLLAAQDEPEDPAPVRAPLIDELNCQY
jgi:hypothetical protein